MRIDRWKTLLLLAAAVGLLACGSSDSTIWVHISEPTVASTYTTGSTTVTLSGEVENAYYVHVENRTTGVAVEAGVSSVFLGEGYWEAVLTGLAQGENIIVATADLDNTGRWTHSDNVTITVTAP